MAISPANTIKMIIPHSVSVGTGVGVGVGVGVGGDTDVHIVMVLVSIVTAPPDAKALPEMLAFVVSVMLASARMFPSNEVEVPRVAELPTCQNTLQL